VKRTTIVLPWPPTALSSNTRQHWARLARAKANYKLACMAAVREQSHHLLAGDRWDVSLTFAPPTRRRIDLDNLLSRMKAGIDGVAQALGVDDSQFVRVTVQLGESPGTAGACVLMAIEPHAVGVAQ
jgi:crossover junction endodeoxyribonuclease RusA